MEKKGTTMGLIAILFSFFVMGFVDIVNISTSYVKADFELSDTMSNTLPMMVFVWFALVSVPTGVLMGRIGRKNTVMLSAAITALAMVIPYFAYTLPMVLIAFTLLGIGNTILQVSLNPLLMNVVNKSVYASRLTLGQFIKAICSFLGPVITAALVAKSGDWKLIFPIYALFTLISLVWLFLTPISKDEASREKRSSMREVFSLLKNRYILLYFSVIVLLVGYEIGLMTVIPKFLLEKWGTATEQGGYGLSVYYIAKTAGAFLGAIVLSKIKLDKFFKISMSIAVLSYLLLFIAPNITWVFVVLFVVGISTANVFAVAFSMAMQKDEKHANEISALMITGVAGGALIPPIMGMVADGTNQFVALFVPLACLVYILFVAFKKS